VTHRAFLEEIVRPNVADLSENFSDIRRAFNAVAAVDACAAHLYHYLDKISHPDVAGISDYNHYRNVISQDLPDFALLRDIAKSQKHVKLTRHNPKVSDASNMQVKQLGYGEARYGEGRYNSPNQVVVVTDAGENRVVETIVKRGLDFLEMRFKSYGL
jgi:hypothetical protein